jgi:tRNA A37 methylthiotransferase MiaB
MSNFHIVEKTCYRRKEETHAVRRFLLANGWDETNSLRGADLVVCFACSGLRYLADEKLKAIQAIQEQIRPGAELIVGGCLPGIYLDLLRDSFKGKILTPTDFNALNDLPGIIVQVESMPRIWGRDAFCREIEKPLPVKRVRMVCDDGLRECLKFMDSRLSSKFFKHRLVMLQRRNTLAFAIAAGCSRKCAYCAKPLASGVVRSKPMDAVLRTVSQGIQYGYRAFDLYADSIGMYGIDQKVNFGNLLDRICEIDRRFSVGLFDLHPQDFIKYFPSIDRLCQSGKLHYLYVAVQSGNERVLKAMNRKCDVEDLLAKLVHMRKFNHIFMQSGIIAGFPGESEDDFNETLRFLERVNFDDVYMHYYCDMPNSQSSKMQGKVGKERMLRRLDMIRQAKINHNFAATLHEWESNLASSVMED